FTSIEININFTAIHACYLGMHKAGNGLFVLQVEMAHSILHLNCESIILIFLHFSPIYFLLSSIF
ncbi:hypothetical protein ACQP3J_29455, partial [Escherichia coli]